MYSHKVGNLFDFMQSGDAMVHGCNTQGVMGSGIAAEVRQRFPQAYDRYCDLYHSEGGLILGDVQYVYTKNRLIINAMTQDNFGRDGDKYASYDAIDSAFCKIVKYSEFNDINHLYFPLIGAGLGGAHWPVIDEIIKHRLQNARFGATLVTLK